MPATERPTQGRVLSWSGDPLLAAKFAPPAVAPALVTRPRLTDALSAGAQGPLTLVTGPAGAGKSAACAGWSRAGAAPGPVAWLTLDPGDGAPGVFWSYVLEALRRAVPGRLSGLPVPACPGRVASSLLVRLAAALEGLAEPVVLVLDGFEKVTGRQVPAGLDFLLAHAGPRFRLVVSSRVDPLLPLHRYRAEGRLTEIRGAALAFTPDETAALLRAHGLGVRDDAVRDEVVEGLARRTEGWAAGLRLCAVALQDAGDPAAFVRSFAASERAVSDYLLTEVLDAQPAGVRELLLRSSILDRVDPAVVDALTGRPGAEGVLERLGRDSVFLEIVPGTDGYRFHPLFAGVLRRRLQIEHPALVPRLHGRAAHLLASAGRPAEALEHAVQAGQWRFAASEAVRGLLVADLLAEPETSRIEQTFSCLPASVPGAEPALVAAACRLIRHDGPGCRARLRPAEDAARQGRPEAVTPEFRLTLALLRLLSVPYGPCEGPAAGEEAAAVAADLTPRPVPEHPGAHPGLEALRLRGLARSLLGCGLLDAARRTLAEAVGVCPPGTAVHLRHTCLGLLALAESADGALTSAEDHALESLAVADRHGLPAGHRSGTGLLALAAVALAQGDAEAARRRAEEAALCPDTRSDPLLRTQEAVLRCRFELAHGRWEAAAAVLAGRAADEEHWPAQQLALARAGVAQARGDHLTAAAALRGGTGAAALVALARSRLAMGSTGRALALLARAENTAHAGLPDRVAARLLRAQAAVAHGEKAAAERLVGDALDAARPERLRRPFIEAGPWLPYLLERSGGAGALRARSGWLTERAPGSGSPFPGPLQPLSARERDVLACVQRMMSADEIAAELGLSVNTVKTHLRSVYRKLCVSRRRDAVERGRELRLL
ncbi:LuxR C-terminal-related transcriptional regulator [Streptomyces sp. NPDC049555]|uniref:LuxR C-terminal-related transcriptional regulator n=1 Tax=Streptomyces sp. NPDC049555 TaxID=3154930 RepID=UPI00344094EC